jgi:MFS transporter, FHS family, glucose/mannose:H+ symporter
MSKPNGLRAKIGILSSFFVASLFICGLPIFVMQAVSLYHVSHGSAGALESYQNIPQIIISFIVFSYITRIGYRKSLTLIAFIMTLACIVMPYLDNFWAIKLYMVLAGMAFVCTKITVYSATALVTKSKKGHVSFLSIMEGIFMFGTMFGMWVFSEFMKGSWMHAFWIFACLSALRDCKIIN